MYFQDLERCRYHAGPLDAGCWQAPLLAVGWLEHPHHFARGESPQGLVGRLQDLVAVAEEVHSHYNFRGLHQCSLCRAAGAGYPNLDHSHVNVLIPGCGVVYAAPAGIVHYIQVHSYVPPSEFIDAALHCPIYGSTAYYEALRDENQGAQIPVRSEEEELRLFLEETEGP